jgi:hypothetical protein
MTWRTKMLELGHPPRAADRAVCPVTTGSSRIAVDGRDGVGFEKRRNQCYEPIPR